jgi:hypothetical protein
MGVLNVLMGGTISGIMSEEEENQFSKDVAALVTAEPNMERKDHSIPPGVPT